MRAARIVAVLAGVVVVARVSGLVEWWAFYHPWRQPFVTPAGAEDVRIRTPDGLALHGWFMRAKDAAPGERRPAILHVHGNAGNVHTHVDFSRFLTDHGFHVLIFDYRSYGRSEHGRLTRGGLHSDTLAAYDALAQRPDVDASRIGVYGVSLGGVFAMALATERPRVAAVCTVSTFSAWQGVASDHVPILGPLLIASGLDPRKLATRLGVNGSDGKAGGGPAMLIVHGRRDSIVPAWHAERIHSAATAAGVHAALTYVDWADHNNIIDFDEARETIHRFFTRSLGATGNQP